MGALGLVFGVKVARLPVCSVLLCLFVVGLVFSLGYHGTLVSFVFGFSTNAKGFYFFEFLFYFLFVFSCVVFLVLFVICGVCLFAFLALCTSVTNRMT